MRLKAAARVKCELVLVRIINCLLAGAQRLKLMIHTTAKDIWSNLQQDERQQVSLMSFALCMH